MIPAVRNLKNANSAILPEKPTISARKSFSQQIDPS